MTSYIRTDDHLTIVFDDGVSASVYASTPKYKQVVAALAAKDYELVRSLSRPVDQVKAQLRDTFGFSEEKVTIEHGIVKFEGEDMDNTLTRRMLQMLEEGFDIAPLKLFLIKLQGNPSFRAVNELYGFLEKGNLPITEDGYFLAYKKVRADYKDVHSGTFDNSVGKIVEMPRNHVDEDSRNECSAGLHFCSKEYLGNFGGERTVIVKIDPADVVAIPADYNSSKGRACRYEVIGELSVGSNLEGSFRDTGTRPAPGAVTQLSEDWLAEDEDEDEDEVDVFHIEEDDEDDVTDSAFVGIPADDSVTIPRDVALEIAASLDDSDVWSIEATDTVTGVKYRFETIRGASDDTGANASSIRKCLNGQRNTAGGYTWAKVDNG